jgi:hypothetical protein
MKLPPIDSVKATLAAVAVALMALAVLPGCKKTAKPPAPAARKSIAGAPAAANTTAGSRINLAAEFISVFDDSPPPGNKGRDPFNPNSHLRDPAPPPAPRPGSPAGPSDPQLKLLGVVGSPGRWLAAINNQILATKEEASIRVPGGSVRLQVLEIGSNYADVMLEGTAVTKRLTLSLEK